MKITTFSDYALRVLIHLAVHKGQTITTDEIATAYGISFHHVAKAAQWLARENYVTSERGRSGGLTLNKPVESINIGAVVKATESGTHLVDCMRENGGTCCISPACGLQHALTQAQDAFYATLERYTLGDITQNTSALQALLITA